MEARVKLQDQSASFRNTAYMYHKAIDCIIKGEMQYDLEKVTETYIRHLRKANVNSFKHLNCEESQELLIELHSLSTKVLWHNDDLNAKKEDIKELRKKGYSTD